MFGNFEWSRMRCKDTIIVVLGEGNVIQDPKYVT
jgi:hypothetical protein